MYAVVTDTKNKGGYEITIKTILFSIQWYDDKCRFFWQLEIVIQ